MPQTIRPGHRYGRHRSFYDERQVPENTNALYRYRDRNCRLYVRGTFFSRDSRPGDYRMAQQYQSPAYLGCSII